MMLGLLCPTPFEFILFEKENFWGGMMMTVGEDALRDTFPAEHLRKQEKWSTYMNLAQYSAKDGIRLEMRKRRFGCRQPK